MQTNSRFKIGTACRAGVFSSLVALASLGDSFGQEPLVLDDLKLLRPPGEACTITFGADEGQQIGAWSSTDLKCWVFVGACNEVNDGSYQFVDLGAIELPDQFYRFETFNPEVPLPPQFEQLRMELGEEGFGQWLQSNFEETGSFQGISEEQVEEFDESTREQFQEIEGVLDFWLRDLHNEPVPIPPELEFPPLFEEVILEWGAYDFGQLLVGNMDQWGNLQGVCEPLIIYWEEHEPLILLEFQNEEQTLGLWLEDYMQELPPLILENFMEEEQPLPPHFEQLRQQLGDQSFAEWLHNNLEQFGNLQGFPESDLPEEDSEARKQFEEVEATLERWLHEFENAGLQEVPVGR